MRTTFISSHAMTEATRLTLMKSQVKLAEATKEAVTGRHADVGLALGYKTGHVVSFRQDVMRLTSITTSNESANLRLDQTQTALKDMSDQASQFQQSVLAYLGQISNGQLVAEDARAGMSAFIDKLNTTSDGAFLFAGINSDVKPMTGYFGETAQTNVQAAIATLGPPGAITPAAMQTFLDGPFAAMFDDPAWGADWSSASDSNIKSRISTTEMIDTSVNANAQPLRDMMQAFAMLSELGTLQLNPDTLKVVAQKASQLVTTGVTGLSNMQAVLGVAEQRISESNERMSIQIDIIKSRINVLEGVDPNEASVRVTALEQQIQLSYAITGKLQALNILDYL
jgi:flagellar hook-associated protein 3 FlgL